MWSHQRMRLTPVLMALTVLIAACSKAPPVRVQQQAAATQQPAIRTIRMAMWPSASPLFDPVIAAFQDKHPEYRVETVPIPMAPALEEMQRNGSIDLTPNTYAWEYLIRTGRPLLSLDSYVAKSGFDIAPFGPLLEGDKSSGRLYGLPLYGHPFVFAYNKQLVKAAGVTIPTDSWSWEEFRATAARLTSGTGDEKIWGFDWSQSTSPEYIAYMMALQRAPAGGVPDRQTVHDVVSFFEPMVRADQSMPPRPAEFTEPPKNYCGEGKAALCFLSYAALSRPEFANFGMAPFPVAPNQKPVILAYTASYGILNSSKEPEAAWALLSFMAGPEGSRLFAGAGQIPVYSTDANRQAWLNSPAVKSPEAEQLFRAPWYLPPGVTERYSQLGAAMEAARQILTGTRDIDRVMANYDDIIKKSK